MKNLFHTNAAVIIFTALNLFIAVILGYHISTDTPDNGYPETPATTSGQSEFKTEKNNIFHSLQKKITELENQINELKYKINNLNNFLSENKSQNSSKNFEQTENIESGQKSFINTQDLLASFSDLDKDNDGKLKLEDINGEFEELVYYDVDGNGFINKKELENLKKTEEKFNEKLKEFDNDNDSKISFEEFSGWKKKFYKMDENSDGFLSNEEFIRYERNLSMLIKKDDLNKDKRLSLEEFPEKAGKFNLLDKNLDGFLEKNEIEAAIVKGLYR